MIEIKVLPQPVFIEKTALGQHLSFDFLLQNSSDQDWLVQQVDLSVLDAAGHLVLRQSLNTNGIRPGIETLGLRTLEKDSRLCVYNPFHTLPAGVPCDQLSYEFHLTSESGEAFQAHVLVSPEFYETQSDLRLHLAGRLIVHDGHDFYAHHRRVDLSHPFLAHNMGFKTNSGRYAYDFCPLNTAGDLVGGAGDSEKDWYGYGQAVLAPGHGRVIAAENQMQDNILGQRDFDFEQAEENPNSMMGNYVLIDHLNGEYSLLAHLKRDSLLVQEGATVEQGHELGRLGFSGSTGPWVHLHYELRTGIDLRTARGLPVYFRNFSRFRGQKQTKIERGQIDTGDIIESD